MPSGTSQRFLGSRSKQKSRLLRPEGSSCIAYQVEVSKTARKQILVLPAKIRRQVENTIDRLVTTLNYGQRPQDMKALKGEPGVYRIDTGEYRVLFYIDEATAFLRIGQVRHRREAYR